MSAVTNSDARRRRPNLYEAEPPGTDTRRAALALLDAVLRKGLPLEAAGSATARLTRADDKAFALAIASEVLRRLPDLDALIDSATQKNLPDDARARHVLRIALVQALRMGTPPHAAISTALPMVESGPRRLVHGVFGALMRSEAALPEVPTLPAPVALRWEKAWGPDMVADAARAIADAPPLDLCFPADRPPHGLEGISLLPGHLRLPRAGAIAEMPGYNEGAWWVQDISAQVPARLLGDGQGRTALDLCAAPGGKTMQLAAAGFRVTAVDSSEMRLERVRENLARTRLEAELIAADVMTWQPKEPVDAILLDAPCSATGIFRRHPDVLHRVRPSAIAELAEVQRAMLLRAADWLKPGGILVYAVCSLEPQEGEPVAEYLLASRDDYEVFPMAQPELPVALDAAAPNYMRCWPGAFREAGGADGFFIARFRRRG